MQQGSYQFEQLVSQELETVNLLERAQLRLEGFVDLLRHHKMPMSGVILEVGCAHGLRTHLIAKHARRAKVIGIDRSPELLQLARDVYQKTPNLSFQQADLYDLPFPDNSIDFIYVRLVFMHLLDPISALLSLRRVLKPGGRLLIEDGDRDCMFFEPAPPRLQQFWQKVQEGQRRLGGDPNVGRKLGTYLKSTHFQHVQIEVQPIIGDGDDIAFLVRTLMPSLNLYLPPEDRAEGELAIRELAALAQTSDACFYHFWFTVSGAK